MSKRKKVDEDDKITYHEHKDKSKQENSVWAYFLTNDMVASNERKAKCKLCDQLVLNYGGTTTKMWDHLKRHNIHNTNRDPKEDGTKSNRGLDSFVFKKVNFEIRVVKLIVLDNIPFLKLSGDTFRTWFAESYNRHIPTSPNTYRSIMMNHANLVKENLRKIIEFMLSNGDKLCISFDEWSSLARRR